MPKFGPHLKDIDKGIKNRIAKLGLVPAYKFDPKKHHERFYTVVCVDKNNKKVIFKMRTENYPETRNFFRKEIRINQLFADCYKDRKDLSAPKYIDGNYKTAPEWMIYDYIEGKPMGDFYSGFNKKMISKFSVGSFINSMKMVHSMSSVIGSGNLIKLEKKGYEYYKKELDMYSGRLKPFFLEKEVKKAREVLNSYRDLLDESCVIITHGDLHAGNIIITDKKQIAVIDWFYVHLNNIAFDVAFLYMERLYGDKLRKEILINFIKEFVENKEIFSILFRLAILRIAPQKINVLFDSL